jgi:hypothetical protein
MEKAMSENCRHWTLLKVAIVGLQNDVFVGRLFFGDPLTGKVHWDCDCRPSDGCFLSIKVKFWHIMTPFPIMNMAVVVTSYLSLQITVTRSDLGTLSAPISTVTIVFQVSWVPHSTSLRCQRPSGRPCMRETSAEEKMLN